MRVICFNNIEKVYKKSSETIKVYEFKLSYKQYYNYTHVTGTEI